MASHFHTNVLTLNLFHAQVAERREANGGGPVAQSASMMLKRYAEYNAMQGLPVQQQECSIWPCIRDVLVNLTLPNEPPLMNTQQPVNVPMGMASGGPQPQQQVDHGISPLSRESRT